MGARRADALVGMASMRLAAEADPDRATVVVHVQLDSLISGEGGCEVEGGGVVHPETVRRLLCTGRVQTVLEDASGTPIRLGRMAREPSAWMMRQLKYRDSECRFSGCGARRFTQAHHIVWWEQGGRTDLDNLLLVCTFHHKLVHEYGWTIRRAEGGTVRWFYPDGDRWSLRVPGGLCFQARRIWGQVPRQRSRYWSAIGGGVARRKTLRGACSTRTRIPAS